MKFSTTTSSVLLALSLFITDVISAPTSTTATPAPTPKSTTSTSTSAPATTTFPTNYGSYANYACMYATREEKDALVLEDVPLNYEQRTFNGSLLKVNIFRQDASPEVDAAWYSIGVNYRPLIVPSHLAQKSGLAPDQVKINPKYGGGYPANVEGLHHLHCLDLLR
ncbi:hypothetical protein G7Y89_g2774 [Cudoniella acicularis]|uniref:Uncharacterized protein n=1 Tax=Cudoniella acicularis TaxID=354080 RepID=A0A8H4RTX3_9HELO|nr:hypothetical protein G7Y89_g2774 [Cudoniella acicularis]